MNIMKEALSIAAVTFSFGSVNLSLQSPKDISNLSYCVNSLDHTQILYRPDLQIPEAVLKPYSPIPIISSYQTPDGKNYLRTYFGDVLSANVLRVPCNNLNNVNPPEAESIVYEDITSLDIIPFVIKFTKDGKHSGWDELPYKKNALYNFVYPKPHQDYFPSYLLAAHNTTDIGQKIVKWYEDENTFVKATFFPNKTRIYLLQKYGRYPNKDVSPYLDGRWQTFIKTSDPTDNNYALYLRAIEVVPNYK